MYAANFGLFFKVHYGIWVEEILFMGATKFIFRLILKEITYNFGKNVGNYASKMITYFFS